MNSTAFDLLLQLIHAGRDPYDSLPWEQWRRPSPDWGAKHEWLRETVIKVRPSLIIEVGSFLGGSAIHFADCLVENGIAGTVLCVDTWLGGVDHRLKPAAAEFLGWHFGRPTLYYSFLANVIEAGHSKRVVPFPLDSQNAARFLSAQALQAQFIYIDSSHESGDVLRDLEAYWDLLEPGGVMLIDDVTGHWPDLCDDVDAFCAKYGLTLEHLRDKGRVTKKIEMR